MKKVILLLALLPVALGMMAQEAEEPVWMNDRDTANSIPHVGIVGDVVSGYKTTVEATLKSDDRLYWYQKDDNGNPIRKIVVLKEKWPNAPQDILEGDGGYKVAAVTDKEYQRLWSTGAIWGEVWQFRYPEGIDKFNHDTVPNVPGYEIVCYQLGEDFPFTWGEEMRKATRELMSFTDSTTMTSYMTVAANKTVGADYTPSKTNNKYDTRWMLCDDYESEYWFSKWQRYQDADKQYLDAYQEWLNNTSPSQQEAEGKATETSLLGVKAVKGVIGVKANSFCGYIDDTIRKHSALTPLTPCNSSNSLNNSSGKLNAIIGNVLSGYKTVALPFDGQSTRFRWFWTDSVKAIDRQIVVLTADSPYVPDSIKQAGGGYALAAVDADDYLYFKERGMLWGECWEITPSGGAFEFVCLKSGKEWMADSDPDYLRNSRELLFYIWNNGKKDVHVPTVGANRTKGASDYAPLWFPVRMVGVEVK